MACYRILKKTSFVESAKNDEPTLRPRAGCRCQYFDGIITPNGLCFERHHAGVPDIDPEQHRLIIHGMVDRELIFTMDDLVRFSLRIPHSFSRMLGQHPELEER